MSSRTGGCLCGRALGTGDITGECQSCRTKRVMKEHNVPSGYDPEKVFPSAEAEVKRLSEKLARAEAFVAAFDAWDAGRSSFDGRDDPVCRRRMFNARADLRGSD